MCHNRLAPPTVENKKKGPLAGAFASYPKKSVDEVIAGHRVGGALQILVQTRNRSRLHAAVANADVAGLLVHVVLDRKSTRLNSSHLVISYAVFCLHIVCG